MYRFAWIGVCLAVWSISAHANDAAAETAAGGIQLRQEHNVVMEKERLFISQDLVRVEYEFRNTSKEAITSEVAFPIAPYEYRMIDPGAPRDIADFKVWVDGKIVYASKEARAFVKDVEVTDALRRAGITIENFGDFDSEIDKNKPSEIAKLSPDVRAELVRAGALEPPDPADPQDVRLYPLWTAHVIYHWTQTFPPGEVVKVKHEYHPVVGFESSQPETFEKDHPDAGMDQKTREYVQKRRAKLLKADPLHGGHFFVTWVKYILTTANTWQGPIRDFELVVKKPEGKPENYITTFSWDGPVERIDATTFRARKTDFQPKQELTVYFLRLALATVPDE